MADSIRPDGHAHPNGPDAHGEAALFLVEGLLHALTERSIITLAEAVEIVETAIELKVDGAAELGHLRHGPTAHGLLKTIVITLRNDL